MRHRTLEMCTAKSELGRGSARFVSKDIPSKWGTMWSGCVLNVSHLGKRSRDVGFTFFRTCTDTSSVVSTMSKKQSFVHSTLFLCWMIRVPGLQQLFDRRKIIKPWKRGYIWNCTEHTNKIKTYPPPSPFPSDQFSSVPEAANQRPLHCMRATVSSVAAVSRPRSTDTVSILLSMAVGRMDAHFTHPFWRFHFNVFDNFYLLYVCFILHIYFIYLSFPFFAMQKCCVPCPLLRKERWNSWVIEHSTLWRMISKLTMIRFHTHRSLEMSRWPPQSKNQPTPPKGSKQL